ncbi:MAG TPA: lysylphosphatidylglycerol synthase transmembrane domain-containing protein [Thermoanaerobaculia bacterium]|jgi:uncharacterized membrane protein YbhN (UPF0104 family)|nr:lysylphosphatidylglycerol synthase transmembrane domain-containing protein [Thermoanaerobaculia bacterium]
MQPAAAHGLCIACLLADGAARAWRLRILVGALGGSVSLLDALWANLVEDAAASLTPMRLGGLPARAVMLRRAGVGTGTIVVASVAESVLTYPVLITIAVALALAFAPDWWRVIAPRMVRSSVSVGGWLVLALILGVVTWLVMRQFLPHVHSSARLKLALAGSELRRAGVAPLAWSLALTVTSTAARLAVLPMLTRTVTSPPPLGVVALSSFALLYGQLLLPVPSGAGAVELGFLAGGAGVGAGAARRLLLAWRLYTALIAIGAGLLVVVVHTAHSLTGRGRSGEEDHA